MLQSFTAGTISKRRVLPIPTINPLPFTAITLDLMNIYILSRNPQLYSTRRLADVATQRGHIVKVVDYMLCNVLIEKGNPRIFYGSKELPLPDAVIPRIGASKTFYGSAVVRQFEMLHIFTSVKSQA